MSRLKFLSCLPSYTALPRSAVIAGVAGAMLLAMPASLPMQHTAHAQDDAAARSAITAHPNVDLIRTQVCQFFAQADIARATKYPQLNLRVTGGNALKDKIKNPQTRSRRFDNDQTDAVATLTQNLYDWGITDRTIQIAEINRTIAKIDLKLETDRQIADMLSIIIRYREIQQHDTLYKQLRQEIEQASQRIEERVNAGTLTLTDLRELKISALDVEVAHLATQREIEVLRTDLDERFQITIDDALPLLATFEAVRPEILPQINSENTDEIRKLDFRKRVNDFELDSLKARNKPALQAFVDTRLFDIDDYDGEFEIIGRVEMSVPLYDGGSNKASQQEVEWRRRSVVSERVATIRNYDSQNAQIKQSLDQLDYNIQNTEQKIEAVSGQLQSYIAREGQTVSDPLTKVRLMIQLNQHYIDHIALQGERDREFLRGIFFADNLGTILNFSDEVTTC